MADEEFSFPTCVGPSIRVRLAREGPATPTPEQRARAAVTARELRLGVGWRSEPVLRVIQQLHQALHDRDPLLFERGLGLGLESPATLLGMLEDLERDLETGRLVVVDGGFPLLASPAEAELVVRERSPLPEFPEPPTAPSLSSEKLTFFEARFVDEIGKSIGGFEVEFTAGELKETLAANPAGVATLEDATSMSATVSVVSAEALDKILSPRWKQARVGSPPTGVNTKSVLFTGDPIAGVSLKAAVPNTIVIKPPLGKLFVELLEKRGRVRHVGQDYGITGPQSFQGKTDEDGRLVHNDVVRGDYQLTLTVKVEADNGEILTDTYKSSLIVLETPEPEPQVRMLGAVPQAVMARIRGMLFDTHKSFLIPTALPDLAKIRELYEDNDHSELLIVGHTDTTADAAVNDPLSLERADNVAAFLEDDPKPWLAMFESSQPESKRWGNTEDMMMIAAVLAEAGVTNDLSIKGYQKHHNTRASDKGRPTLEPDGQAGPKTREELILDYMALDGATLQDDEFDIQITTHGCGENFPLDDAGSAPEASASDDKEDPVDRRVELFFFDQEFGIFPKPPGKNSTAGSKQYLAWRRLAQETLDLSVTGEKLEIVVEDDETPPNQIADAEVSIDVPGRPSQLTDAEGKTTFLGLEPGKVRVTARAGGASGEREIVVGESEAAPSEEAPSGEAKATLVSTDRAEPPPSAGGPVVVPITTRRLRLSLFDFNPSFTSGFTFAAGKPNGFVMNTALLDDFQKARIDDYSLVRTISFQGADTNNDANKPDWSGFSPLGNTQEAMRVDYMQKLTSEMHSRGAQVLVGYEMVERGATVSASGRRFRSWLANASGGQVTAHAQEVVAFFSSRNIPIDGVGFDIELNSLNSTHSANLAILFNETAKAVAAVRPGAFVYYDNAPFQPDDGKGSTNNMAPLKYALASGAPNLIARPMCYNGTVTSRATIEKSIACALKSTASGGGGLLPSALQCAIDIKRTSEATVKTMCKDVFRKNLVGMTMFTMPGGGQKAFLEKAAAFEAQLNPGVPAPGTSGQPFNVPVP